MRTQITLKTSTTKKGILVNSLHLNTIFKKLLQIKLAKLLYVVLLQNLIKKKKKTSKYNYSRPITYKSERVGYQSNQKLLHHC